MKKLKIFSIIAIVIYVAYAVIGLLILIGVVGSINLYDGEVMKQNGFLSGLSVIITIDLEEWGALLSILGWAFVLLLLLIFGFIYAGGSIVSIALKALALRSDKKQYSVVCLLIDGFMIVLNAACLYSNSKQPLFEPTMFIIFGVLSLICLVLNILCVSSYRKKEKQNSF